MRKKSLFRRMVKIMSNVIYDENFYLMPEEENDDHAIARCEECGELIYEDSDNAYVDDDGNYFCCQECALDYYSIKKVGD